MAVGRITHGMLERGLIQDLGGLSKRVADAQQDVATGKKLRRPSDDPLGAERAVNLRAALHATDQQLRNVSEAQGWLTATEDAMGAVGNVINRAHELLIQGASDSSGPQARASIALEIDQLIESVKQSANASYEGRFLFAGTATTTKPYGATDAFQGNTGSIARSIGPGVSVVVNTPGADLFGSGQAANDDRLLDVLRDIADHLRSSNPADHDLLRTSDIARLDANLDRLYAARAQVGATANRLDSARERLLDVELTSTKLLSETEDADLSKAVLELNSAQSTYQAAMATGARIIQPSLLDFLR